MADAESIASNQNALVATAPVDTGLGCLGLVLALSGEAFDLDRARRELLTDGNLSTCDGLVRIARAQRLKASVRRSSVKSIQSLSLPLIARSRDGSFFVIDRLIETGVLIGHPGRPPVTWPLEQLECEWSGELVLVTKRDRPAGEAARSRWFSRMRESGAGIQQERRDEPRSFGGSQDGASNGSGLDLDAWMRALRALPTSPVTEGDLLTWVEGPLRSFVPFERFLGGYGILSSGRIHIRSLVTSGHTQAFLAGLDDAFDLNSRGCFTWWVSNRKPFILDSQGGRDEAGQLIGATKRELDEIKRFSLGVVAAHGVIDPYFSSGTYLSFAGVPRDQPKRILAALDLIAPVLHSLFLGTKASEPSVVETTELTERQRHLIDLAVQGLSDKEIALRLGISHNTVGNHFSIIYSKLGIKKRSQLFALVK